MSGEYCQYDYLFSRWNKDLFSRLAKQDLQDIHPDSLVSITHYIVQKLIKCIESEQQKRHGRMVDEMY